MIVSTDTLPSGLLDARPVAALLMVLTLYEKVRKWCIYLQFSVCICVGEIYTCTVFVDDCTPMAMLILIFSYHVAKRVLALN